MTLRNIIPREFCYHSQMLPVPAHFQQKASAHGVNKSYLWSLLRVGVFSLSYLANTARTVVIFRCVSLSLGSNSPGEKTAIALKSDSKVRVNPNGGKLTYIGTDLSLKARKKTKQVTSDRPMRSRLEISYTSATAAVSTPPVPRFCSLRFSRIFGNLGS